MTFSNRGSYGGNRGQNYGRDSFGGRGSERPTMYDAICAKCGVDCQVPFRPNGRKEVFCSKCFETNGGGERNSDRGFSNFRSPQRFEKRDNVNTYFADKQMFDAVCDECGESCKIPFQPRNGKPVLCSNCFAASKGQGGRSSGRQSDFVSRPERDNGVDLEVINAKLDKIIKMLSPKEAKEIKEPKVALEAKEITEKILEEIQTGTEKKLSSKKKTKATSKKKA